MIFRGDAYKKNQISKLCSSKLLSLSQPSLLQKRWAAVLPPGGLQSAAQPGTACWIRPPGLHVLPTPRPWSKLLAQLLSYPSLILPTGYGPTLSCAAICVLAPLGPKKSRSKRPSKTDQFLMLFQHRFLSVLAPFWRAKMAPKSIKNQSKLNFRAFLFPHRFLHRFFIEFSSQLRPTGSPKSMFFLRKNKVFSKNAFRR